MNIKIDIPNSLYDILCSDHEPIIFTTNVELFSITKPVVRMVVITYFRLFIIKKKKPFLKEQYLLMKLRSIKLTEKFLEVTFEEPHKVYNFLISDHAYAINDILQYHCTNLFTNMELAAYNIQFLQKVQCSPVPFNRFVSMQISTNNLPSNEILNQLYNLLNTVTFHLDLTLIEGLTDYLYGVFYMLDSADHIIHVTFGKSKNLWDPLKKYFSYKPAVKMITFTQEPEQLKGFDEFLSIIANSDMTIEFKSILISSEVLELILKRKTGKLFKVIFTKCSFDVTEEVLSNSFSPDVSIRGIWINYIHLLNRQPIIQHLSLLKHVSLTSTDLDVSILLSSFQDSNVSTLNFSNNNFYRDLFIISLPENLQSLRLDSVKWGLNNVKELFMLISKHENDISISLCNNDISQESFSKNVYQEISQVKYTRVVAFHWANNFFNNEFGLFLQNFENLHLLSLAGVDIPIKLFNKYIPGLPIRFLDLHGTSKYGAEEKVICYLKSLKKSNIKCFNFSGNNMKGENFSKLPLVLEDNFNIQSLNIDNNNNEDFFKYSNTLLSIEQNTIGVHLSNPKCEINKFVNKNIISPKMDDNTIKNLKNSFFKTEPLYKSVAVDDWFEIEKGFYREEINYENIWDIEFIDAPKSDYRLYEDLHTERSYSLSFEDVSDLIMPEPRSNLDDHVNKIIKSHNINDILKKILFD